MTRDGWEDVEDREAFDSYFYDRVRQRLFLQEFNENDLKGLEHEKTWSTSYTMCRDCLSGRNGSLRDIWKGFYQGRMTDVIPLSNAQESTRKTRN